MEEVAMNERKRVANIKAVEEKNDMKIRKLAEKHEKSRQIERRKEQQKVEREIKQKNISSIQALTKHYQNQIELVRNQLDDIKFENYIVETAQREQISKAKQEVRDKYRNMASAY